MSKRDLFISYANSEVYHGKTTEYKYPGGTIPGFTRVPSKDELNAYFTAGGAAGYDPSIHWCGIFQVYLLKKAGVLCRWDRAILNDIYDEDLEITSGPAAQTGLQVGDIVRVRQNQHHLMVLDPVSKGFIRGIEGNAGGLKYPTLAINWMGNAKSNIVEEIEWRYRIVV
jgi:hypothetical protein